MSKYLKKLSSGLIYQEDFDNVDPWTRWAGTGNIAIISGKLRISNANDFWYVSSIGDRRDLFIQLKATTNRADGRIGPLCRGVTYFDDLVYGTGDWGGPNDLDILYNYLGASGTALWSHSHGSKQRDNLTFYDLILWAKSGDWRVFYDCNQGGHGSNGSNMTQQVSGKTGIVTLIGSPYYTDIERYNIMTDKSIECSGMHDGWKLRIDEDDTYKATESGGTATVDCFDLIFPVSKVELLDGSDIVQDTFELSNAIWAGDRFEAGSYKYNLDSDALAFKDLCRIDVNGVPGEWF